MQSVKINLLGREYNIKCQDADAQELSTASTYLSQNIKHHFDASPYVSFTDALVISALNTCHLMLKSQKSDITTLSEANNKLSLAHKQIKKALGQ